MPLSSDSACYEIVVLARVDSASHDWLDEFTLEYDNGHTRLLTPRLDQAALYGVLRRLRDGGIALLSVHPVTDDPMGHGDGQGIS